MRLLKHLKKILLFVGAFILIASSIANIIRQITVLRNARSQNKTITDKIIRLESDIKQIDIETKFATSSSFLNQAARKYFGRGGENDYWLKLSK